MKLRRGRPKDRKDKKKIGRGRTLRTKKMIKNIRRSR